MAIRRRAIRCVINLDFALVRKIYVQLLFRIDAVLQCMSSQGFAIPVKEGLHDREFPSCWYCQRRCENLTLSKSIHAGFRYSIFWI